MWKLMCDNAITQDDRESMAEFITNSPKLTQGEMVKKFEREWSKWQGCKYSVFVNSGSSANLLAVSAMKEKYKRKGVWYAQSCTWATNVSPIIQIIGNVGMCDADLNNFGPDLKTLETLIKSDKMKPRFMFLTHLLGFPAITTELLELCKRENVNIIEDCCESHGATFNGTKVGNFGECSTFSFYYGHHMTTIEGGMVCTNNKETYEILLLLRSHGLLRELPKEIGVNKSIEGLDPKFTFLLNGFNVRNMEMNALLGLRQLKKLDESIKIRNSNYNTFITNIDSDKYRTDFNSNGISSFCLPIYTKSVDIKNVKSKLESIDIEFRPCVGGNLIKHPMINKNNGYGFGINSDDIVNNCVYVGNHQDVKKEQVIELCKILNKVKQ